MLNAAHFEEAGRAVSQAGVDAMRMLACTRLAGAGTLLGRKALHRARRQLDSKRSRARW